MLGALAALGLLFFADFGALSSPAWTELYVVAHLLYFALLTWALAALPPLRRRPFAHRALAVIALVILIGTAIELIQPHFGRSASLRDLWRNLLGALAALAWMAPRYRPGWWAFRLLVLALLAAELYRPATNLWDIRQAHRQFPLLSGFETAFEDWRWSAGTLDDSVARAGRRSLRLDLVPARYSGTTLKRGFGDWTGYGHFAFSLHNPDPEPLRITVSIRDHEHFRRGGEYPDRFNRGFVLKPGWNDIVIPVEHIARAPRDRTLDMSDLAEVVIFTVDLRAPRTLYLDQVQLQP